ncbi:MAG: hypothetical protein IPP56_07600 [Bacteroidetes bacterium]|nr:hypothetical protein [Bacteroidota bacterium]MBK9673124.1 hypothetical protein [Bacteroidota bacterium]MBK9799583.1 hypothetical protein [Bacteroidota bacterium]MBP6412715.1 hypothetical protein [Bacteroidia bacterium]
MKLFQLQLLVLCLFLISSCKKISNSKIDACIYVKQYKTETPIANAEVQILRGKPGTGYGTELVETVYTNDDGKATYKTKVDKNYNYYAFSRIDNYYNEGDQVNLERGKRNFETTIYKYANAYVKLHIKNTHPFNQFDLVQLTSFCHAYNLQGIDLDTTILWCMDCNCSFFGNYTYNSACLVTRNNLQSNFNYSFIPTPFDTITVDINF